jgi:hypothetical protein
MYSYDTKCTVKFGAALLIIPPALVAIKFAQQRLYVVALVQLPDGSVCIPRATTGASYAFCVKAHKEMSLQKRPKLAYCSNLAVAEVARRRKVAARLLDEAEAVR